MEKKPKIINKWLVLVTVSLGSFMFSVDTHVCTIAFPRLTEVFGVETSTIMWVTVSYLLVSTSLLLVVGRLGDIYGRKKVYIAGLVLFTAGLVLCSVSRSVGQLILFRIVQGIGGGMNMSVILAIVTDTFPDTERGMAMGVLGSVLAAGVLVGPVLGGLLLDTLGWRAIFYTRVPIGVIGIIMAWVLLREQKAVDASPTVDYWGAGTLIIGLSCLLLFLNLGESLGFTSLPVLLLIIGGVVLLTIFVIQERRISQPVVDLRLFKNRLFTGGNISLFVSSFSMSALIFLTPFFMIGAIGISALELGMLIATSPLTSIIVGPLAGWLSDKIGTRFLQTTGIAIVSGSLFIFSGLTVDSTSFDIILGMVVFGIGMGIFNPTVQSSVMGSVPRERLGTGSAMMNTTRQLATSVGTVIAGIIYTNRQAHYISTLTGGNIPSQLLEKLSIASSYQDALLISAIICCFGIITSFVGKSGKLKQ